MSVFGRGRHLLSNGGSRGSRGSCLCSGLVEVRDNVSPQSLVVFKALLTAIAGEPQVNPGMMLPLSSSGEYSRAKSTAMHVDGSLNGN